jgi:hypothetical protein
MNNTFRTLILAIALGWVSTTPAADKPAGIAPVTFSRTSGDNKYVYAHFVTWFKTRERSGRWEMWNSDYADARHNPDEILENGHRDVATTAYPLSDVYDTCDPDIMEYQFLLMKLAGVDGVIVDWDGRRIHSYRHEGLMTVLPYLQKYNLKLILCFEEWCGYWPKGTFADRDAEIKAAADEIRWMTENILDKPFYGTVGGRKPVLIFRKEPDQWFNLAEWTQLAPLLTDEGGALIFAEGFAMQFAPVCDGGYFWVGGGTLANCEKNYKGFLTMNQDKARTQPAFVFGSANPSFNDTPVWGWGGGPRISPDYHGARFNRTWELSIEHKVDLVQLVTWNDWNEGTEIEPSDTFGYRYLESTKKYAAQYKGVSDHVPNETLRIPLRLLKARQKTAMLAESDRKTNLSKQLDQVHEALLAGDCQKAAQAMQAAESLL